MCGSFGVWELRSVKVGVLIQTTNQSPKGIMRSLVPLSCFFDAVKSLKLAGQQPPQGMESCRMGKNSVCPSIRPSVRLPKGFEGLPEGSEGLSEELEGLP